MLTQEKIESVKKQLRSGVPEGEIKNELRNEGYTEEEIKNAFPAYSPDMRSWYLFFGIIITGFGLWRLFTVQRVLFLSLGILLLTLYYKENRKRNNKSAD